MPFDLQILNCDNGNFDNDPVNWGLQSNHVLERDTLKVFDGAGSARISGGQTGGRYLLTFISNAAYTTLFGKGTLQKIEVTSWNKSTQDSFVRLKTMKKSPNMLFTGAFGIPTPWYIVAGTNNYLSLNNTEFAKYSRLLNSFKEDTGSIGSVVTDNYIFQLDPNLPTDEFVVSLLYKGAYPNQTFITDQTAGLQFWIDKAEQVIYDKYNIGGVVTNNTSQDNLAPNGAIDITITGGSPEGYTVSWLDGPVTEDRTNLAAGIYTITVIDNLTGQRVSASFQVLNEQLDPLMVDADITNPSVTGEADGQITAIPSGGTGNYSYLWSNAETTQTITGLVAGTYSVTVTDTTTLDEVIGTFELVDPVLGAGDDPYFEVPKMQSLQFTKVQEFQQFAPFNYFDSLQHKDQILANPAYEEGFCYIQKYLQGDVLTVQVRSSSTQFVMELWDTEGLVQQYTFNRTAQYRGIFTDYPIEVRNNGAGTSRVFFTEFNSFPIALAVGDVFEISGNADGFNGGYTIISIGYDAIENKQYLVINKNYALMASQSFGTGSFDVSPLEFDIYETIFDTTLLNEGYYYLKAYQIQNEEETVHYSEPIYIGTEFPNSNLITWTNIDNAFDIDYTANIEHKLRVDSLFYKRLPATQRTVIRNTDNSQEIVQVKPQRKIQLELFNIPPYMAEKLAIALSSDSLKVNGVEYVCEEGLQEAEYTDRYGLVNAIAVLEQNNWFGTYNANNLGGIEGNSGFITANQGFIKR